MWNIVEFIEDNTNILLEKGFNLNTEIIDERYFELGEINEFENFLERIIIVI